MTETTDGPQPDGIGARTAMVLQAFLDHSDGPQTAWDVAQSTGLPPYSVHRIIAALQRAGLLEYAGGVGSLGAGRGSYAIPPAAAATARRRVDEIANAQSRRKAADKLSAISPHTAAVLRAFLDNPGTPQTAWDIMQITGLPALGVSRDIEAMQRAELLKSAHRGYTMPPAARAAARHRLAEIDAEKGARAARAAAEARRRQAARAAEYKKMSEYRAAGVTWRLIAERLGYNSHQAAQARYRSLSRDFRDTLPRGGSGRPAE